MSRSTEQESGDVTKDTKSPCETADASQPSTPPTKTLRSTSPLRKTLPDYYKIGPTLGYGAYGTVVEAQDTKRNASVAIKQQCARFDVVDKKMRPVLVLRAYRELLLLFCFQGHPNILELLDVFEDKKTIKDVEHMTLCTVTDKVDMNLLKALKDKKIKLEMRPSILHSILCGVKYIHSAKVLHRDLKPENIGITFFSDKPPAVKLLDFGLARKLKVEMSYEVQRLYYRAPEVWLQPERHTEAIDIWSVGCILAELITGKILMRGEKEPKEFGDQLKTISRYTALDKTFLETVHPAYLQFVEQAKPTPLEQVLQGAVSDELELLNKILVWSPTNRWTACQCLEHAYFAATVTRLGTGATYSGTEPQLDYEDVKDKNVQHWTGWFNDEVKRIKAELSASQATPGTQESLTSTSIHSPI